MVEKDAVYKALSAYGVIIRTNILTIPDRIIDNVIAAKSRAQAHLLLYNALVDALEDLSKPKDFDFTP